MTSKYNTESQQSKFKQLWSKLFFPLNKVINWYSDGGLYQFSPTKYQDIEKNLSDSEPLLKVLISRPGLICCCH